MLSDTHPSIQRLQIELAQRMTAAEKVAQVRRMTDFVVRLSRRAIARANPELSQQEVDLLWVELSYGRELAAGLREESATTGRAGGMRKAPKRGRGVRFMWQSGD
jgi:hypothetical protein